MGIGQFLICLHRHTKVRTSGRYVKQNKGYVCGMILVYLLMLITHVSEHAGTQKRVCDNERGVP